MKAIENIYRLSPMQEGMLFHSLSDPSSGMYVEQASCDVAGDLDSSALRRSWEGVLARHPILRASFHWQEVDRPVQVVYRQAELPWREEDWRGLTAEAQAARFDALLEGDRRLGFDLDRPPLMRVTLLRLDDRTWRFLWSHHHLLLDGWSLARVLQEVFAGYRNSAPPLPPARPYVDYIAWLEAQSLEEAEAFWRRTLGGFTAPTPLPMIAAAAAAVGVPSFEDRVIWLGATASASLEETARRSGVTLGTLVQAAWAVLLARTTGEDDVVFGTVVSGRPPHLRGSESMVGLFINTLPARVRVNEDEPLLAWLQGVQESMLGLRQFEHSPLAEVQKWSDVRPGEPLFQTLVAFENYPRDTSLLQSTNGLQVSNLETAERTNYPLNVAAVPLDGFQLRLTWDRRFYSAETAERLLSGLRTLLEGIPRGLGRPLEDLPLLGPDERDQILALGRGRKVEVPDVAIDVLLQEVAAARPDAPAIVASDGSVLSYRELFERASRIAARLRELGVGPEAPVGLLLERTPDLVAAMIGVWKAGGAFVPLDPEYPPERLRLLLEDSRVPVLVTSDGLLQGLPVPAGCRVMNLTPPDPPLPLHLSTPSPGEGGATQKQVSPSPGEGDLGDRERGPGGEGAAYIIYTSGSTGRPKGVVVRHRGVVSFLLEARRLLDLGPESRVPQTTSPSFDASVLEIFPALLAGGTLFLLSRDTLLSGPGLADELRRLGITAMAVVPSLVSTLPEGDLPALRTLLVGAERCPSELVARWSPGRRFINAYGPTETSVFATAYEGAGEGPPPIGRPIANLEVYVADRRGRPVPMEVPGEIWLGGTGLARGYLDRPDLTAERFVPHPDSAGERLYQTGDLGRWRSDGHLEFLGRIDHQVKIRGHRVECGEIEATLASHPGVRETAVIGRDGRLVAFVVRADEEQPDAGELRRFLAASLPAWMIPAGWVFLEALPLSPAGKIDRRALARIEPEPERREREEADAPRNPAEETLARIWADVLRVERVGIRDSFFDLGGDSILSIQVVARAAEAGLQITPRQVFERPTIAELAEVAVATVGETGTVAVEGPAPLTPIQRAFFERSDLGQADPHHFNMAVLLIPREPLDPVRLERALGVLLDRHDALRLRFEHRDAEWRQRVEPPGGPVPLSRFDLSALPASAREAAFLAAAEALQGSLDLERGVVRAALLESSPSPGEGVLGRSGRGGRGVRVLLLIHHLAVDAVSWRVLLEDFERAYLGGEEVRLPPATTPFLRWAERLAAFDAARELPFWRSQAPSSSRLPLDSEEGEDTEGTARRLAVALDAAATRALLKEAHRAYQTRVDELVLAALAEAVADWTGERTLAVDIEGHGREPELTPGVDLSRTVGWFTTIHPVQLDLRGASGPGEVVKTVKEALRRVPGRGFGYGVLRYLRREPLPGPEPEIAFNYLGQIDLLLGASSLFEIEAEPPGRPRSPRALRPHRLEINAWVRDGLLTVDWSYGARRHKRATIERLAGRFLAALREIIDHCLAPDAGGFTPSDFPAAELDQKSLDRLLGKIAARRR